MTVLCVVIFVATCLLSTVAIDPQEDVLLFPKSISPTCGSTFEITWSTVPSAICAADFEGFFPSINFQLTKLVPGNEIVVATSLAFNACDKNKVSIDLPKPLPTSWFRAGGSAGERVTQYRISGMWLNPAIKLSISTVTATFLGSDCIAQAAVPPDPTAANVDCRLSLFSSSGACSNICGPGTRIQRANIIVEGKGSGRPCPTPNCGVPYAATCVQESVSCNGAVDNPAACRQCAPGSFDCDCKPNNVCDGSLACESGQCRSPSAPPIGCANCECRRTDPFCDRGLSCFTGKCKPTPKGCVGCACDNGACDAGLICGGTKLCLFPEAAANDNLAQCPLSTQDCPCGVGDSCEGQRLVCTGGKCRAVTAPGAGLEVEGPQGERPATPSPSNLGLILGVSIVGCCLVMLVCAGIAFFVISTSRNSTTSTRMSKRTGTATYAPSSNAGYLEVGDAVLYPSQQGLFPSQASNYPSQSGSGSVSSAYPSQRDGNVYPSQQGSYPSDGGSNYPSQAGGHYPSQSGGNYPSQAGDVYPSQRPGDYQDGSAGAFACHCGRSFALEADLTHHKQKRGH